MNRYEVRYQAATYEGTVTVWADDEEQAIAIARGRVRKQMTLPMYYESYTIVGGGR